MKKWVFGSMATGLVVLVVLFGITTLIDRCAAGLILNMIGVLIVFVFGFPQPDYDIGCVMGLEKGTVIDEDTGKTEGELEDKNRSLKKWHKALSILGMAYLFAGFGFQLWYQLAQSPN